jgi:hypothetical protein
MTLRLPRSAWITLSVAVLHLGTLHSWGFYTPTAFFAVVLAWALSVAALFARPGDDPASQQRDILGAILIVPLSWVLTFAALGTPTLLYGEDATARFRLWVSCYLGCLSVSALPICLWPVFFHVRPIVRLVAWSLPLLTIVFGFTTRALTLAASPDPVIDVFPLLRDGADHIRAGRNPYAQDITSPYGTERAARFGVTDPPDPRPAGYPPLPLLLAVPPRWFGADVRWSNVVADLLAGLALGALALRRRASFLGIVAMATYLNAVRVPFLIEQAWYEPMIAALFGWGLVFVEHRTGWRVLGHILLGLGLTAKQFGLPLLVPLAAAFHRQWKLLATGLLIGGALMVPWFLASPGDFLDIVLWKHLARPIQYGSITLASWFYREWGLSWPKEAGWALASVLIAVLSLRTPRESAASALGLGTVLLTFCLCHSQGFPNYFALTQYLWLVGLVGGLPGKADRAELPQPAAPT